MDVTIANTPHHKGRMNFNFTSRIFQVLIILGSGFISHFSDCLTVNAVYRQDIAEFTCTISPYTLFQRWYIDSVALADCGAVLCSENISNPVEYSFTTNVNTGIFVFKIEPIKSTDDERIVECFDGTNKEPIKIDLTVIIPSEIVPGPCGTLCIVLICVGIVLLLIIFLVIIIHYCVQPKFTKIELEDIEIHLEWTDSLNFCCSKIFRYSIVCNPTQGQVKDKNCRKEFTKKKKFTLENLDPMAIYQIRLSRKLCCFKSSATQISVITRKAGMLNDQEYTANLKIIEIRWTKPDCISNPQLQYEITCNKVKKDRTDKTMYTIKDLIAYKTYKIEVVAINNGKNSLLFTEEISATPIKLCLGDVCYRPEYINVKCNIRWTVSHKPEPLNKSDKFHFNVICRSKEEQVQMHKKKKITDSSYTIPDLYPDRSYTVYVYVIYNSIQLEPPYKIKLAPYTPTWDSEPTPKSTEIELKWKKPEYTGDQPLEYEVVCNREMVAKTPKTSYTIENCKPCQKYDIEIFTIINKKYWMKSLPLQRTVRTQPVQHGGNHHLPNNAVDAL